MAPAYYVGGLAVLGIVLALVPSYSQRALSAQV
jgi:hypothetical protein